MAQADFKPIRKMGISNFKATLLGSAAAWLLLAMPISAQEAGLRRTFDNEALNNSVLQDQKAAKPLKKKKARKPSAQASIPAPEYRPENRLANADGLPDETAQEDGAPPLANPFDDPVTDLNAASQKNTPLDGADTNGRSQKADADSSLVTSDIPVPGQRLPTEGDEEPDAPLKAERDNLRETPAEGRKRKIEDDPYAAPGIQAGAA
jgi:hypothetical protein